MLKHLKVAGCPVSAEHVECITCQKPGSGNFAPDIGRVILCSRGWGTKRHLEDTIVHELLHIYDHCRFKVDWTNLRHVACSEVSQGVPYVGILINPIAPDQGSHAQWRLPVGERNQSTELCLL